MMLFYLLSYLGLIIQIVFVTLSTAAGLFYLAELVEEYTVVAKNVISWLVFVTASIHIGLIIFEDLPLHLNILGLIQQMLHVSLLRTFPAVIVTSLQFIATVATLILHHYLALRFFGQVYYSFSEVLSYFTLCLWLVPGALFVSLSANDLVLPVAGERQPLIGGRQTFMGDENVVTNYLSRARKRYNLLSFFSFAKESLLPTRNKSF